MDTNSEKALTHYRLGRELLRSRRFDEAASAFNESLSVQPDLLASVVGLALCYTEQKNGHAMFETFGRALALMGDDTPDAEKWNMFSQLYLELGYTDDSREAYNRALGIHRNS